MDKDVTIPLVPIGTPSPSNIRINDDLEQLLQNIFKLKLEFPSDHPEIKFIQTGLESIFSTIAKELNKYKNVIFEKDINFNSIVTGKVKETGENNLWTLGSFYEFTRNCYPDELDFVYVPFRLSRADCLEHPTFELKDGEFRKRISYLANAGSLIYRDDEIGEIFFEAYDGPRDVGSQLRFTFVKAARYFRRGRKLKRNINVNLIPGVLMFDEDLKAHIHAMCPIKGFRDLVLQTASNEYLLLPERFTSFSETEVHFMKHVLSPRHVKAYRIIKYIVNGRHSGAELSEVCAKSKHNIMCSIPPYAIKTAMIRHHYECQDVSDHVSGCVLAILHMFEQSYTFPMPKFGEPNERVFVDIATPTNRPLTIAYGDEDFIVCAQRCLSKFVRFLRRYKKRSDKDWILDPFSARMTSAVTRYNNERGTRAQRMRMDLFGEFGIDGIGKCCFSLMITAVVVTFCAVMLWVFSTKT